MDDICTKIDCFGYHHGKCKALTEICENCAFYKPKEQYYPVRLASFEYIEKKYGKLTDTSKRERAKLRKEWVEILKTEKRKEEENDI